MIEQNTSDVQSSYDHVADEYVRHIYDELRHKPLDRQLLDKLAANVGSAGLVCDLGCGPGHVARYLREEGAQVCGVDLSEEMVDRARRLNPGIEFTQGDMLALNVADGAWAGIAAFYSIVNLPRNDVPQALGEMWRVLQPGGHLLLAFHIGDNILHEDDLWGIKVCLDFYFFNPNEVTRYLRAAGFEVEEITERDPYPEVEYPSRRAYIFAGKPRLKT
jgi:ubiquinone/menaquinone biosynthesis C-methylase UbiE